MLGTVTGTCLVLSRHRGETVCDHQATPRLLLRKSHGPSPQPSSPVRRRQVGGHPHGRGGGSMVLRFQCRDGILTALPSPYPARSCLPTKPCLVPKPFGFPSPSAGCCQRGAGSPVLLQPPCAPLLPSAHGMKPTGSL